MFMFLKQEMPEMDGFEKEKTLKGKNIRKHVRVLANNSTKYCCFLLSFQNIRSIFKICFEKKKIAFFSELVVDPPPLSGRFR